VRPSTIAVGLFTAVAIVFAAPGFAAAACQQWTGAPPPSPGTQSNALSDVAVLGRCNAYAVGEFNSGSGDTALMERYNGTGWRRVTIPTPGTASRLEDVSPSWAVGTMNDSFDQTFILRRVGSSWAQITSPSPSGTFNELFGVVQLAPDNAWAVGDFQGASARRTLILHWNGTKWRHVPSPNAGGASTGNELFGIDAVSAHDIWAVGFSGINPTKTLVLHWNGTKWKLVPSPNASTDIFGDGLTDVAAVSRTDAWAAGSFSDSSQSNAQILQWNGTRWKRVSLPNVASSSIFQGITAFGAKNVWAIGEEFPKNLVVHWNGHAWKRVSLPSPGLIESIFYGVDGTPNNVWLVGKARDAGTDYYTQAQHCC
jgi:hypothetical protein